MGLALDAALQALARFDPRQSRIVELRYFGGLEIDETAAVLGISPPPPSNANGTQQKHGSTTNSAGDESMAQEMTPDRWQQIKRTSDQAVECETSQREALLTAACAGDDAFAPKSKPCS